TGGGGGWARWCGPWNAPTTRSRPSFSELQYDEADKENPMKSYRLVLVLAAAALGTDVPLMAQHKPQPTPPSDRRSAAARPSDADGASVDSILAALYASVSHDDASTPNWERMRAIFLQGGMLTPPKNPKSDMFTVLDVDGFEQRVKEYNASAKAKGDPTSFFEREVARRTDCFGNVCQV